MTIAGYSAENATFSYDDFGQLTGADRTGSGNDEAYDYDDNGNRESANGDTYTPGTNNQIESDGTFDYLYDDEGNRIRKTEIATGDYVTYEWDYRNRLTAVCFYDDSDVLQKRVENTYDVFDRWIAKQVDSDGDTDFDATEAFVYDGTQIVLRFADDSEGPLDDTSLANRYIWGPVVDQLLADEQVHWGGSAYVTDQTLWPLGDHLNTNRDLVTYNSSMDTSTVANHLMYDSFGNVADETHDDIDELFLFTGRAFDVDTGLQNNWHRWHDAVNGQWMSEDPIVFAASDTNLRRYVGNAPASSIDPSGLQPPTDAQKQQAWDDYDAAMARYEKDLVAYQKKKFEYLMTLARVSRLAGDELWDNGDQGLRRRFEWLQGIDNCTTDRGTLLSGKDHESMLQIRGSKPRIPFPGNWRRLSQAIKYSDDNYGKFENWVVIDGGSFNPHGLFVAPLANIRLNQDVLNNFGEELAVAELIHESLHDLVNYGPGHNGIAQIVPTGEDENGEHIGRKPKSPFGSDWEIFVKFAQNAQCNGKTLWVRLKDWAGGPPKKPIMPVPPAWPR